MALALRRRIFAFLDEWAISGGQQNRVAFRADVVGLLIGHYARTALSVTGGPRLPADAALHEVIAGDHAQALTARAARHADMIIALVERDIAKVTGDALHAEAAEVIWKDDGHAPPVEIEPFEVKRGLWAAPRGVSVAIIGSLRALKRRLSTRMPMVANAETQEVAEDARIRVVGNDESAPIWFKTWNSLMDGRERPAHHEAHGQTRRVEESFEVGGEELRFPGDASRGASLGNLINCRCFCTYAPEGVEPVIIGPGLPARRTRRTGDEVGRELPATPSSGITFGAEQVRAKVVLANGQIASVVRDGDVVRVIVSRREVARAGLTRSAEGRMAVGSFTVVPTYRSAGIGRLIDESVEATNRLRGF